MLIQFFGSKWFYFKKIGFYYIISKKDNKKETKV